MLSYRLCKAFSCCLLFGLSLAATTVLAAPIGEVDFRVRDSARHRNQIARARRFVPPQLTDELRSLNLDTQRGRKKLATMPVTLRAALYLEKARQAGFEMGHAVRTHTGRNTANPEADVPITSAKKLWIEVNDDTLPIFIETMGQNMIWPSGGSNAWHLYTLFPDQDGSGKMQSITYGEKAKEAKASAGNAACGILLPDAHIARAVRMVNRGIEHPRDDNNRSEVYGYRAGDGEPGVRCTNWLTGMQIGEVVEQLGADQREQLRQRYPFRPEETFGRQSLAHSIGLSRARDPGIWMGKLMLSDQVPVVAFFGQRRMQGMVDLSQKTWNLDQVGELQADGTVVNGAQNRPDAQ